VLAGIGDEHMHGLGDEGKSDAYTILVLIAVHME